MIPAVRNQTSYQLDARPFLKWAGGKTQLLPELMKRVPDTFGTYYEPFLGGGALFFALRNQGWSDEKCVLSDLNEELVNAYKAVRDMPGQVIGALQLHEKLHSKEHYMEVRTSFPDSASEKAARTIYLNKAGFNGLYRVNKAGGFNVPWGKHPKFGVDHANLWSCAGALARVRLHTAEFDVPNPEPVAGDFIYFDPPYLPVSDTANFTAYTKDGFTRNDQVGLASYVARLKDQGVHVLVSNSIAALPIYEAVSGQFGTPPLKIEVVQARRAMNSKGSKRGPVEEILVS